MYAALRICATKESLLGLVVQVAFVLLTSYISTCEWAQQGENAYMGTLLLVGVFVNSIVLQQAAWY